MHPIGGRPWCGRQWRLVRSFVAVREASAIALEELGPVLDFALSIFKYRAQKDNEGMITRSAVSAVMRK
jgi:hypothetical protein